jgi:hypothetical protein
MLIIQFDPRQAQPPANESDNAIKACRGKNSSGSDFARRLRLAEIVKRLRAASRAFTHYRNCLAFERTGYYE